MKDLKTKLNDNIILFILVNFIAIAIFSMILWPVLDLIICNLITHSKFNYEINAYMIQPTIYALIISIIFGIFHKMKDKD